MPTKTREDFKQEADLALGEIKFHSSLDRRCAEVQLAKVALKAYQDGQQNPVLPEGLIEIEQIIGQADLWFDSMSKRRRFINVIAKSLLAYQKRGEDEGRRKAFKVAAFFACTIKSGEPWSDECERQLNSIRDTPQPDVDGGKA